MGYIYRTWICVILALLSVTRQSCCQKPIYLVFCGYGRPSQPLVLSVLWSGTIVLRRGESFQSSIHKKHNQVKNNRDVWFTAQSGHYQSHSLLFVVPYISYARRTNRQSPQTLRHIILIWFWFINSLSPPTIEAHYSQMTLSLLWFKTSNIEAH